MTAEQLKKPFVDAKDFLEKTAGFVKRNVGVVMGLCLLAIALFASMVIVAWIAHLPLVQVLFQSWAFVLTKLVVLIVLIYTGISALDYMINFIMIKLPQAFVTNMRNDFMVRMNYMSMRANTNAISAILIRFFNVAAFSPTIINSPTMNFLIAFLSMFGVVIILVFKHIFLWLFHTFIKPVIHLFWKDKLEPKKEAMTGKIKSEYRKVEEPLKKKREEKKANHKMQK